MVFKSSFNFYLLIFLSSFGFQLEASSFEKCLRQSAGNRACIERSENEILISDDMSVQNTMTTLFSNNMSLDGAKFLPYIGNIKFHYPEDVLWGFYPDSAQEKAVICAEIAYNSLLQKMNTRWPKMQELIKLGATNSFYLWVNDFSNASADRARRFDRFWHWSEDQTIQDGYWVWEAILTQDNVCHYPSNREVDRIIDSILKNIEK